MQWPPTGAQVRGQFVLFLFVLVLFRGRIRLFFCFCFAYLSYVYNARFLDVFRILSYAYESLTVFRYLLESKVWFVFLFIQNFTSDLSIFSWNESLNKYQTFEIIRTQFWQFEIVELIVHNRCECSIIFTIFSGEIHALTSLVKKWSFWTKTFSKKFNLFGKCHFACFTG